MKNTVCHVLHIVYRFATGGLENVVVQLINNLPHNEFHHTIIALTEIDPLFVTRIKQDNVDFIFLNKAPGQTFWLYPKIYRVLRKLKPDVLHSCNLAAMELTPMSALARVPLRIQAEHGLEVGEISGNSFRHIVLRKMFKPFVHEFITVSAPLHDYLERTIGVPKEHLHLIPNGVDTDLFRPRRTDDRLPEGFPFRPGTHWIVGMVGRLVPIKNPMMLVEAFVALVESAVPGTESVRLAIVGEGPLDTQIMGRMRASGLEDRLWLPGVRSDIPEILRTMDCFVLPSLSEATSCTLQEAMATGLDIVATDVGGNSDLLDKGSYGNLIPSGDAVALTQALLKCLVSKTSDSQSSLASKSIRLRYGLPVVIQRYRGLFLSSKLR